MLLMLWHGIKLAGPDGDRMLFKVIFLQASKKHETVTLKAICGPGDQGEPVLTVMLPAED